MARAHSPRAPAALLDLTREVFAQRNLARFGDTVLDAVGRTVPFDYAAFQEIDVDHVEIGSTVQRPANLVPPRDVPQIIYHLKRDHPLIRHYARSPASGTRALSDFMTRQQFHRTGLYAECYRALGAEFQVGAPLPSPTRRFRRFIALNRQRRDFTTDERRFLDLARYQVALALLNAQAFDALERRCRQLRTALEASDQAVVIADWRGGIRLRTEPARGLIDKYFTRGRATAWLPDPLRAWARQWVAELGRGGDRAGRPLIVERGRERLTAQLLPDWTHHEILLLFDETRADPFPTLDGFGLSTRESEVLSWVARGKTNADIGAILGISPRTVQKHLEHVFEKLGVETRTAAAAHAPAWFAR